MDKLIQENTALQN